MALLKDSFSRRYSALTNQPCVKLNFQNLTSNTVYLRKRMFQQNHVFGCQTGPLVGSIHKKGATNLVKLQLERSKFSMPRCVSQCRTSFVLGTQSYDIRQERLCSWLGLFIDRLSWQTSAIHQIMSFVTDCLGPNSFLG